MKHLSHLKWKQLFLFLFVICLLPTASGDDDDDDDDDDETILGIEGDDLGEVAYFLLIGSLLIIVWKPSFFWLRKNGPELFNKEKKQFKRKLGVFNKRFMTLHYWLGLFTVIIGTIHGIVLEWHWTLWTAMVGLWIVVFTGWMMRWKWPPREFRRGARLLHLNRSLSIIAVVLLFIGHEIVD